MNKAALVVMAAGLGSRFGGEGAKQLEPVGPNGELIMEYSVYDAVEAGFDKVVFVIRRGMQAKFHETVGSRVEKIVEVDYVYQELEDIPEKWKDRLEGRTKPWGTGQAILCCKDIVKTPFLVINADDYYGKQAYREAYQYLTEKERSSRDLCMVGFVLKNTLSENGAVTRGICQVGDNGMLQKIVETRGVEKYGDGAIVRGLDGTTRVVEADSPVSMNMWGLQPGFFEILESGFQKFLENLGSDRLKAEYLLPTIVGGLLQDGEVQVKVLASHDRWFGVTYKEDKEGVAASIKELTDMGVYPETLF